MYSKKIEIIIRKEGITEDEGSRVVSDLIVNQSDKELKDTLEYIYI